MKRACGIIVTFVFALSTHPAAAQQSPAGVLELMKSAVIPASDAVFAVGKAAPKTDGEWAAVAAAAAQLVEAAKKLDTQAPASGGASWTRFSRMMAEAAAAAGKAAQSKNADAVLDAGDALYSACEDCHKQFMKK
jgi:cytochrome c556